ncbi:MULTISPECIES: DUF1361 domain-containing protein [Desertifilum]|nr:MULTISPECIES: DUF1361 domain-containing protein [Desertifilum]MDA0211779.1 DUF1361 domain-containing protein [Cyanobacteria bacterium FC1]
MEFSRTMGSQLFHWLVHAWDVFLFRMPLISWNLFLGLIPLALSYWLFKGSPRRTLLWGIVLLVFIAFLPNAPYVLTDVIHLVRDIRYHSSIWLISLVLLPQYFLFILIGVEAYVISIINLGDYLRRIGWRRYILPAELLIHALSAVGIYLGRFKRFNSWDLVTNLDAVTNTVLDDLLRKWPVLVIAVTFVILTSIYWLMKQVTLGVFERFHSNYSADSSWPEEF